MITPSTIVVDGGILGEEGESFGDLFIVLNSSLIISCKYSDCDLSDFISLDMFTIHISIDDNDVAS